jgi:Fe-Mn family superoxide dismutase
MAPNAGGVPTDTIAAVINRDFGSYNNFVASFKQKQQSSLVLLGFWLVVDKYGKLKVTSSQNQDNPLMRNALVPGTPILGIDLWEHSYYLGYQYRRRNI